MSEFQRRGFTLIELLLVMSVIGIMMAFLIPSFSKIQDRSREMAVKSIANSVKVAVESYKMVNETYPIATNISLRNLYDNYLKPADVVNGIPKNPFTNKEYQDGDIAGKIIYNYDMTTDKYLITAYNKTGTKVILQLSNNEE